jgi:hypothetical protein
MDDQIKDSSFFAAAAHSLVHNLDALRNSFVVLMVVSEGVQKHAENEHAEALEKYGVLIENGGEAKRYSVPLAHRRVVEKHYVRISQASSALELMPRSMLVAMVSEYDAFLGRILRAIYSAKPEILNRSERKLTFSELSKYDSIADARGALIEAEVEALLRESHGAQFDRLEKMLEFPLRKNLERWGQFVELTQRRNLFVHCDGIVSAQYVKVCVEEKGLPDGVQQGDRLSAPYSYLIQSYKCLYEIAVKLSQVLWRKLAASEDALADRQLNDFCYELLVEEKNDLAIRLLEFSVSNIKKPSSDSYRKMFVINLAQAYKFSEESRDFQKVLDGQDWSSTSDDFKLCVAVLNDQFSEAAVIMARIGSGGLINEAQYLDWPIFRIFRGTVEFKNVFRQVFSRDPDSAPVGDGQLIVAHP